MVLSGRKKVSYVSSITNRNQGGGNKKAGFPYQIGRGWRSVLALNSCFNYNLNGPNVSPSQKCCSLDAMQKTYVFPSISRNIGRSNALPYYKVPGLG